MVSPVSCNSAVEACCDFQRIIRTRIGSPYVIAGMESALVSSPEVITLSNSVVVGYDANSGFLLGNNAGKADRCLATLPTRDAVLPMLALLRMAREKGCKLSELPGSLPQRYTASDRLQNFPTETSRGLITQLHEELPRAASLLAPDAGRILHVDTTDGLRLTFANGCIVHLRPSGNAPELRCYAEAETQAKAENICRSVLARVFETTQAIV